MMTGGSDGAIAGMGVSLGSLDGLDEQKFEVVNLAKAVDFDFYLSSGELAPQQIVIEEVLKDSGYTEEEVSNFEYYDYSACLKDCVRSAESEYALCMAGLDSFAQDCDKRIKEASTDEEKAAIAEECSEKITSTTTKCAEHKEDALMCYITCLFDIIK